MRGDTPREAALVVEVFHLVLQFRHLHFPTSPPAISGKCPDSSYLVSSYCGPQVAGFRNQKESLLRSECVSKNSD